MREITLIGLGKMGSNMTLRLLEKGYRVNVYDQ
ncbi:MAG: NAD(P)-binding domain-containing protein, partial [Actinomycetota bacterium]